jgi:hypothetical protein
VADDMANLRSIFSQVAGERPERLPHVATFHDEQPPGKRSRVDDGHAGKVLLRGRAGPDVLAQARRVARLGGISVSAYITALIMNQPPALPSDPNGMTEAFLRRVAASPVLQGLDRLERAMQAGELVDVDAVTAELRGIVATIVAGSPLTAEEPDDASGAMLIARVSPQVAARAHKEARDFESLQSYLAALIRYPRQSVAPAEQNVLARLLPFTLAAARVTSAIAAAQRREQSLGALIPELRAVQRALADRILASRAAYDALIDASHGNRDDVAWSAGFLEDDDD